MPVTSRKNRELTDDDRDFIKKAYGQLSVGEMAAGLRLDVHDVLPYYKQLDTKDWRLGSSTIVRPPAVYSNVK